MTSRSFAFISPAVVLFAPLYVLGATWAENEKTVVLAAVGDMDTNLVSRIEKFVGAHLLCPVEKRIAAGRVVPESPEAVLAETAKSRKPSDVCLVGLTDRSDVHTFYRAMDITNHVGVLNIARLRPAGEKRNGASEQFARRCEKETMRIVGELLGLESCSNMECAMFVSSSGAEMDAKGRAFCPPCQAKAEDLLRKAGVRLTVDDDGQWRHLQNPSPRNGSAQPCPPNDGITAGFVMEGEPMVSRIGVLQVPQ